MIRSLISCCLLAVAGVLGLMTGGVLVIALTYTQFLPAGLWTLAAVLAAALAAATVLGAVRVRFGTAR